MKSQYKVRATSLFDCSFMIDFYSFDKIKCSLMFELLAWFLKGRFSYVVKSVEIKNEKSI